MKGKTAAAEGDEKGGCPAGRLGGGPVGGPGGVGRGGGISVDSPAMAPNCWAPLVCAKSPLKAVELDPSDDWVMVARVKSAGAFGGL